MIEEVEIIEEGDRVRETVTWRQSCCEEILDWAGTVIFMLVAWLLLVFVVPPIWVFRRLFGVKSPIVGSGGRVSIKENDELLVG